LIGQVFDSTFRSGAIEPCTSLFFQRMVCLWYFQEIIKVY